MSKIGKNNKNSAHLHSNGDESVAQTRHRKEFCSAYYLLIVEKQWSWQ